MMDASETSAIAKRLADGEEEILAEWLDLQKKVGALQTGRITESELRVQSREFLHRLQAGLAKGGLEATQAAYSSARDFLGEVSRSRAIQGFSPKETATFVFSLKQPLFNLIGRDKSHTPKEFAQITWAITRILDELGLHSFEVFQKSREDVISRQQREISELSTPVVQLWDGILALPIIGTVDSERTQVVMENLLQRIVEDGAEIAIIDITGVPTVDTLTAQHLLKTVAAARLMGADCIISGIRPQIAQTMVHLGVELNVISKATVAEALAVALRRTGRMVVRLKSADAETRKSSGEGA
jgi:rsbT co-antagonist protein RsbR